MSQSGQITPLDIVGSVASIFQIVDVASRVVHFTLRVHNADVNADSYHCELMVENLNRGLQELQANFPLPLNPTAEEIEEHNFITSCKDVASELRDRYLHIQRTTGGTIREAFAAELNLSKTKDLERTMTNLRAQLATRISVNLLYEYRTESLNTRLSLICYRIQAKKQYEQVQNLELTILMELSRAYGQITQHTSQEHDKTKVHVSQEAAAIMLHDSREHVQTRLQFSQGVNEIILHGHQNFVELLGWGRRGVNETLTQGKRTLSILIILSILVVIISYRISNVISDLNNFQGRVVLEATDSSTAVLSKKLESWLKPLNFDAIHDLYALPQRQSGTGQWLLQTTEFKEWCAGKHRMLWIEGIRMYHTKFCLIRF